jgi:hypothetical protein
VPTTLLDHFHGQWICPLCTLKNLSRSQHCKACGDKRSTTAQQRHVINIHQKPTTMWPLHSQYKKICFVVTGISREIEVQLEHQQSTMPLKVFILQEELTKTMCAIQDDGFPIQSSTGSERGVTHIITSAKESDLCPRTIKYLSGILSGKLIVKYECKNEMYFYGSQLTLFLPLCCMISKRVDTIWKRKNVVFRTRLHSKGRHTVWNNTCT